MEQWTKGAEVEYGGARYRVGKIEGDKANIYIARRSYTMPNRAVVKVAELKPWVPKPKVNAHAKTCQICARPIYAEMGVIAHHGYTRPLPGLQTSSCWGARHLPFDKSRDELGAYIAMVEIQRKDLVAIIAKLNTGHATIDVLKDMIVNGRTAIDQLTGKRIKEWVPYTPSHPEYAHQLRISIANREGELRALDQHLEWQRGRFENWKPVE